MLIKEKYKFKHIGRFYIRDLISRNLHFLALCVGPFFILFAMAIITIAIVQVFHMSTEVKELKSVFFSENYWFSVSRTLIYASLAIILKISFVWPLAIAFQKINSKIITISLLLPWVIPSSVSSLAWLWFFYDLGGGANFIVGKFGISDIAWLGTPKSAFTICLMFNVWRELPLWAIVIQPLLNVERSSLQTLAYHDSLSIFQKFRLLILPKIRPALVALCILSIIWSIGEFESIWILTRGGPGEATQLISVFAYKQAFLSQNLVRGAAAFIFFIPISVLLLTFLLLLYNYWSSKAKWK